MSTRLTVPQVGPGAGVGHGDRIRVGRVALLEIRRNRSSLTVKSAGGVTVTVSLAVSLEVSVSPPPETVAVLVTLPEALEATLTVSVSAG